MIDKNITFLMEMISGIIYPQRELTIDLEGINWEQIYEMSKKNLIGPMLWDRIAQISGERKPSEELMKEWRSLSFQSMLFECEKYRALRQILSIFKERGITCIVFKGCILADLYPKYYARLSSDTDLLVYLRDKVKAIELIQELGYHKEEEASKDMVYAYVHESSPLKIELHFSLFEDYKSHKIDMLEAQELAKEESLMQLQACGMEITTLGYMEHLIFQMFHIIKHFSLKGVNIRYLIDITLYVNRYGEQIEARRFWNGMEQLGYDQFCESFFAICIRYLNMSTKLMDGRKIKSTEETERFLMDLINVGSAFSQINSNWELLDIFAPFFTGEQDVSKIKLRRKSDIVFPKRIYLPKEYSYAKKYGILLPIAWAHRFLRYLMKGFFHKEDWARAKEKMTIIEHRLSLMRSLGLVDGGQE